METKGHELLEERDWLLNIQNITKFITDKKVQLK
jgi:hypothetical protein